MTREDRLEYYRAWRIRNREKIAGYQRKYNAKRRAPTEEERDIYRKRNRLYYARNREKLILAIRDYARANPEKIKASSRAYYLKNRSAVLAYSARWARDNKPSHYRAVAKWGAKNTEKLREYVRRRKARRRRALVATDGAIIVKWEKKWRSTARVQCFWCRMLRRPDDCHVDHIVALSIGGRHAIDNLCISCSSCNCAKSAKTVAKWNEHLMEPVLL